MPCGYSLEQAAEEFRSLALPQIWQEIPAVRNDRVFVVAASGYFSRPGPRLAAGVEILAAALHPDTQAALCINGYVTGLGTGGQPRDNVKAATT